MVESQEKMMRLKPVDIAHIILLFKRIADALTKIISSIKFVFFDDGKFILSNEELQQLQQERIFSADEKRREIQKEIDKIDAVNPSITTIKPKSFNKKDQRRRKEIKYNRKVLQKAKDKLSKAKTEYFKVNIEPLQKVQKELDRYLYPRWPEIMQLSRQGNQLKQEIEAFINYQVADNFLSLNFLSPNQTFIGKFIDIDAKKEKVIRKLEQIKETLKYKQTPEPAGAGEEIKKSRKPTKTERKFQPWTNSGDACFIIEDNRIKFYYKKGVRDLLLRNETNPHKLLFLFAAKNPLPQVEIKEMCTEKTRPSDIAKQTNTKLNEKIAAMALPDVPKNIEFVKYDDKSKCYGLWPEIKHKDTLDCK